MDFSFTREQKDIKKAAADFASGEFSQELAKDYELNHRYPRELFKKAGELGFIGLDYPEEIGGGGLGILENVLVVEEFCKADSGIGMSIHLGYIPSKFIKINGTPDQRKKYLTPLVKGDWISAVAFTEPDHGSDLTRMETTIEEEEDGFVLRGTKIFTTNAAQADFFVVLAQDDPKARAGTGMTTIILERDPATWLSGKLEINEIPYKMGLRMTSTGELVFHDLKVPKENLLGKRGKGLQNVLDFLDESRVEIAAQALGNAEGAFLKALRYAKQRTQFGKALIDFQTLGHQIGRMWSSIHSLKWLTYYAAWMCDHGDRKVADVIPLFSSMVKHHVPRHAKGIIDDAIEIFGGYGYFLEQDVERRYRDTRIIEVYEGTVQVQLNNIVRILKKMNIDFINTALI